MSDLDQLRELTSEFRPPPFEDLVAVSSTRRRRSAVGAGAVATVTAIVAITVAAGVSDRPETGPDPAPLPTATETGTPADPATNGRVQGADQYLAGLRQQCSDCDGTNAVAFDQVSGRLLLAWPDQESGGRFERLSVIGPDGRLADLSCPADFGCAQRTADRLAAFGPGPEELSVEVAERKVQVVGYDGAVRRTLDLSAVGDELVYGLAWSPDATRLAVVTRAPREAEKGFLAKIWLVDHEGGNPQLVYTASDAGQVGMSYVSSVAWSPDGSRLGFIEDHERGLPSGQVVSDSIEAISLLLPGPQHEGEQGEPTTLLEYRKVPYYNAAFVWSPDGTRVAVRVEGEVLELSASTGTVAARHPFRENDDPTESLPLLVWPAERA